MVFWGCHEDDCRNIQTQVQRFAHKPFSAVDTSDIALSEQEHDFTVETEPSAISSTEAVERGIKTRIDGKSDSIKLASWDDTEGMFVVSYGLALSVMLSACRDLRN